MKQSAMYHRSKNTKFKQESLRLAMTLQIAIVQTIWNNWSKKPRYTPPKPFLYFDLYGGPGIDPDGNLGSPLIFHEVAAEKDLPYRALIYERHETTYKKLVANTAALSEMIVVNADHSDLIDRLSGFYEKWRFGIAYCDPSNAEIPIAPLEAIRQSYPRVDFMINLAAASYKRAVELPSYVELSEILESLKKTWVVRKPIDKHQWTILVGSDHPDYPSWSNAGFERFDSPVGQEWYEKIVTTKRQRLDKYQPALFDVKKKRIEPTPNISPIQIFAPFEKQR